MKRISIANAVIGVSILGVTFAAAVAASAADRSQLAAGAGVSVAEAQSMSLSELAAAKFNRDTGRDGAQRVGAAGRPVLVDADRHAQLIAVAGISPAEAEGITLAELAAGKYNTEGDSDHQVPVVMSSRGPVHADPQLIAAAGLEPGEAYGMSLTGIAAAKFNRDTGRDEQQTPRN